MARISRNSDDYVMWLVPTTPASYSTAAKEVIAVAPADPDMPPKKEDKVVQLKGKEAEDRILQYMKECNRPYGAADVSANIRNVVSKAATQKILATLAERGAITQKVYGKTCYYVANQSECEEMSSIQLDALETRCNIFTDQIKEVAGQQKILNAELARIRSTPDDTQLGSDIVAMQAEVEQLEAALTPLRAGSALLSDEQVRELDREWLRWRSEWVARKKVFSVAWGTATDSLSASESTELTEELGQFEACTLSLLHLLTKGLGGVSAGIEPDSYEHTLLEESDLCQMKPKRR